MMCDVPIRLGNVYDDRFGPSFGGNIWDVNGVAPTLKTTAAASQQFVIVEDASDDRSKGARADG